ncbi:hypothetical protein B0H17DRAFT_1195763 [Mycena rosella]|uniref:Clp1-like protein n=1 Tax=Mycena rosella TaxID=1033263 RepID=A0AAD7GP47_MYCRO|nr:hypothetical protein B0H17DRAFT_1195763 [Mycena rosella]
MSSNQNYSVSAPRATLPRRLERPPHSAHSAARATLDALAPNLVELPIPFIHHQLTLHAARMLAGLDALLVSNTIPLPLPSTLAVGIPRDAVASDAQRLYPTHILAVVPPSTPPDALVPLVPIHGIVLATHCTSPLLRSLLAPQPPEILAALVIPVCRVSLPSPYAFLILAPPAQRLPSPMGHAAGRAALGSRAEIVRLATHLMEAHSGLAHLVGYSTRMREVWQTACCLGMYQISLWDALDLAWEVVLYSLNLAGKDEA